MLGDQDSLFSHVKAHLGLIQYEVLYKILKWLNDTDLCQNGQELQSKVFFFVAHFKAKIFCAFAILKCSINVS